MNHARKDVKSKGAGVPAPADIDDEAQYRVKVLEPVSHGLVRLRPRHGCILKGKIVRALGPSVAVIEKI
ncbi:MAG: hypothetical protein F9K43_00545 [Bauldia sp.]|nr:MAG: hypothetical protein F9K43_00545 [Bauldia sp.]MBZ0229112.1 hypothetical protein [Bauldia sp.]